MWGCGCIYLTSRERVGGRVPHIYDGRSDDGFFHYTGEGQMGDQQMTQGNRAILDHEAEDRDLQLFVAHGTELEYVGCFRDHDHYEADAPEIGTEEIRKVIVFRLEQLDGTDAGPKRTRPDRLGIEKVKEIPVEQQITETTLIEGSRDPHEVERREQKLVQRVAEHLEDAGHDVCRLQPSVKLEPSAEPALA